MVNPATNSQPLLYNSYNNYPLYNGVFGLHQNHQSDLCKRFPRQASTTIPVATGNDTPRLANTFGIGGAPTNFLPGLNFTGGNISNFGNSDIVQDFLSTVGQIE